jgi:hypothetical protein
MHDTVLERYDQILIQLIWFLLVVAGEVNLSWPATVVLLIHYRKNVQSI